MSADQKQLIGQTQLQSILKERNSVYRFQALVDEDAIRAIKKEKDTIYIGRQKVGSKGYPCMICDKEGKESGLFYVKEQQHKDIQKKASGALADILNERDSTSLRRYRFQMLPDETSVLATASSKNRVYVAAEITGDKGHACKIFDKEGRELVWFYINQGFYNQILRIIESEKLKAAEAIAASFSRQLESAHTSEKIAECMILFSERIKKEEDESIKNNLLAIKKNMSDAVSKKLEETLDKEVEEIAAPFRAKIDSAKTSEEISEWIYLFSLKIEETPDEAVRQRLSIINAKMAEEVANQKLLDMLDKETQDTSTALREKIETAKSQNTVRKHMDEFSMQIQGTTDIKMQQKLRVIEEDMLKTADNKLSELNRLDKSNELDILLSEEFLREVNKLKWEVDIRSQIQRRKNIESTELGFFESWFDSNENEFENVEVVPVVREQIKKIEEKLKEVEYGKALDNLVEAKDIAEKALIDLQKAFNHNNSTNEENAENPVDYIIPQGRVDKIKACRDGKAISSLQEYIEAKNTAEQALNALDNLLLEQGRLVQNINTKKEKESALKKQLKAMQDIIHSEKSDAKSKLIACREAAHIIDELKVDQLKSPWNHLRTLEESLSENQKAIKIAKTGCERAIENVSEKKETVLSYSEALPYLAVRDLYTIEVCDGPLPEDGLNKWTLYLKKTDKYSFDFKVLNSSGEVISGKITHNSSAEDLENDSKKAEIFKELESATTLLENIGAIKASKRQGRIISKWNEKIEKDAILAVVESRDYDAEKSEFGKASESLKAEEEVIKEELNKQHEEKIDSLLSIARTSSVDVDTDLDKKIEALKDAINDLEDNKENYKNEFKELGIEKSGNAIRKESELEKEIIKLKQKLKFIESEKEYITKQAEHKVNKTQLEIAEANHDKAISNFNQLQSWDRLGVLIKSVDELKLARGIEWTSRLDLYTATDTYNKLGGNSPGKTAAIPDEMNDSATKKEALAEMAQHLQELKIYMEKAPKEIETFGIAILNPAKYEPENIGQLYNNLLDIYRSSPLEKEWFKGLRAKGIKVPLAIEKLPVLRDVDSGEAINVKDLEKVRDATIQRQAIAVWLEDKFPGYSKQIKIIIKAFELNISALDDENLTKVSEAMLSVYNLCKDSDLKALAAKPFAALQYERCLRLDAQIKSLESEALREGKESLYVEFTADNRPKRVMQIKDEEKIDELEEKAGELRAIANDHAQWLSLKESMPSDYSTTFNLEELGRFNKDSADILEEVASARKISLEEKEQRIKERVAEVSSLNKNELGALQESVENLKVYAAKPCYKGNEAERAVALAGRVLKHVALASAYLAEKDSNGQASIEELQELKEKAQAVITDRNTHDLNPDHAKDILAAINAELKHRLLAGIDRMKLEIESLETKRADSSDLTDIKKVAEALKAEAAKVSGKDFADLVSQANAVADEVLEHVSLEHKFLDIVHNGIKQNDIEQNDIEQNDIKQSQAISACSTDALQQVRVTIVAKEEKYKTHVDRIMREVNVELKQRLEQGIARIEAAIARIEKEAVNEPYLNSLEEEIIRLKQEATKINDDDFSTLVNEAVTIANKALQYVVLERDFVKLKGKDIGKCDIADLYQFRSMLSTIKSNPAHVDRMQAEIKSELASRITEILKNVDKKIEELLTLISAQHKLKERETIMNELEEMAKELDPYAKFDADAESKKKTTHMVAIIREHVAMERETLKIQKYNPKELQTLEEKALHILENGSILDFTAEKVGNVLMDAAKAVKDFFFGKEKKETVQMPTSSDIRDIQKEAHARKHAAKIIDVVKEERLRRLKMVYDETASYMNDRLHCDPRMQTGKNKIGAIKEKGVNDRDLTEKKIIACHKIMAPGVKCVEARQKQELESDTVAKAFKETIDVVESKEVTVLKEIRGFFASIKAAIFGSVATGEEKLTFMKAALVEGKKLDFVKTALGHGGSGFFADRSDKSPYKIPEHAPVPPLEA